MKRFIGNKVFYKMLGAILLPIVLQQLLTQFVGLLDNIMIGLIGNDEMTGVSLANQILFVYNISVFGVLAGGGIFAAQYFGAKDKLGYQKSFQYKVLVGILLFIISSLIIIFLKEPLINLFINQSETDTTNPEVVLSSAKIYLTILIVGNFFFVIKEIYSSSLREQKETFVPMLAGIIAIAINIIFNFLLIYGNLGFPKMGVAGAAIATVISRVVEALILIVYISVKKQRFNFFIGMYKKVVLDFKTIIMFTPKSFVLFLNEFMWSLGMTICLSAFSLKGLDILSSLNISNVVNNLFATLGISIGSATGIVLGNYLGAGNTQDAKDAGYKIMAFGVFISIIVSILMIGSSFIIPTFYNTTEAIRQDAKMLIIICAISLPINSFNLICYFTLRSGGHAVLTFLFDSCFIWVVRIPVAFVLVLFTKLDFMLIYLIVNLTEIIKSVPGYILVDKGIWIQKIV